MDIELRQVIPFPLRDKPALPASAVWNRNLRFLQGSFIKVQAPSGTGKTTLVHILYKLRDDYTGEVKWDTADIGNIKDDALAQVRQQRLSVIFQDLRLFLNLTARENIELKRILQEPYYGAEKIDEMAALLGITHILDQRAGLCSYGEQQRIAIIRALVQPFDWLLMDEPFSHLDRDNTAKASALIARECKERKAGFILADLDRDTHFEYTEQLAL